MDWDNFFHVHDGLPRQGPGTAEDVSWAIGLANLSPKARICDAACGTGGDIAALCAAAPGAEIVAIEQRASFVTFAQNRFRDTPNLTVEIGDLADLPGRFDLIWCAGALYFLGLEQGLATMRHALNPGGVLAFSEPAYFTTAPSDAARAFWDGYPTQSEAEISATVEAAGYERLGQRRISDAGWAAYFDPLRTKIVDMRASADDALTEVLDICAAEAEAWQAVRAETGYVLTVARLR